MRFRPLRVLPFLAYGLLVGLAVPMGCAGAGSTTGGAGSSGTGKGGTTSSPGTAGTSSTGTAGNSSTGTAGTSSAGDAGTTGSAGSVGPGTGGASATTGTGGSGTGGVTGSGTGGAIAGTSGSAGTTGSAGSVVSGSAGTTGGGGMGGICQQAQIKYTPQTPTVYLVVDRSGSMFHCLSTSELVCSTKTDTSWSKLKTAIQTVVMQLEKDVRFGFTTIFGTNPAGGGSCPLQTSLTLADNVAPKLMNYNDIKTKYDSLDTMWPNPSDAMNTGKKYESPAMYSIRAATKALMQDTTDGAKYIILITDGQEDYCDDALEICASDSTVGALQAAAAANIKTIVFGLQTTQFNLPAGVLQAFANAGAGEPTVPGLMAGLDTIAIFDQCQGVMPWKTDLTASGHPTTRDALATVGTYATTKGPTTPFQPSASDSTMLVTQLSQALQGVKSCTFDLKDVNGVAIKVDTSKLTQAHVLIQGTEVPLSATNGWNVDVSDPTTLIFSGSACDTWRKPNSTTLDLQFPCGSIIFE
jgi:hypothetical protein